LSEPLKVQQKEALHERLREFSAYEMGMQIPHRVDTEISQEKVVWRIGARTGTSAAGIGAAQRSEIVEGRMLPDHVHILIAIPPKHAVSQVVGYIKGKSAIHIARTWMGRKRNFVGQHFWARGYYVSTVGIDETVIRQYIRKQEQEDQRNDQLRLFD